MAQPLLRSQVQTLEALARALDSVTRYVPASGIQTVSRSVAEELCRRIADCIGAPAK